MKSAETEIQDFDNSEKPPFEAVRKNGKNGNTEHAYGSRADLGVGRC